MFKLGDGERVKESEITLHKAFELEYGGGPMKGIMHVSCSTPEKNVFECNSEERSKGWTFSDRREFSKQGMVNFRTFHTKNITAKKYYKVIPQCGYTYEF